MTAPAQPGMQLDELLGRVADFTDDVILVTEAEPIDGPGPRIVYVNPAFTRITGYAAEEVIGRTPRLLQGPRTSAAARQRIREALQHWRPIREQVLNYRKDGSEFWAELSITPVADDAGWYRYWIAVQREIDERRQFDDQRRLYQLVLDNIDDGIVVANALAPDMPIEYVNPGFTRVTGYTATDILGRNCRVLQGRDSDPGKVAQMREAIAHQHGITMETVNYRKDGTPFWNQITLKPLRNAAGELVKYVGVQHDVSADKRREQEVIASQRMHAMGQLTGGIAHDFNNLLTVILGNAEVLAESLSDHPQLRELAEMVALAAQRGGELTSRLLAFARRQVLAPRAVDANDLLLEMSALLHRSLGEHIEIRKELGDGLWTALVDPAQLESAVLNLCINARDAMPEGGRLTLRTANARLDEAQGPEDARAPAGEYVALSVSDTGSGMSADVLAHVFEPFFTTKPTGRGTGLGLSMVYGFVKQSRGHVSLESEPGRGTTVRIYLPRHMGTPAPASAAQPELELGSGTVLLVEDDKMVRHYTEGQLQSLGYRVISADNAHDALLVLHSATDIDLLFSDVVMPGGMNGRELATRARQLRPRLAILLASGYADTSTEPDAPGDHAPSAETQVLLLVKPYRKVEMARMVRLAIASSQEPRPPGSAAP